jgi:hypothetical protein
MPWSEGHTSADFDPGRPINIAFEVPMIALLRSDGLEIVEDCRATSIDVLPNLLPTGETFILSAITDGCPNARVSAHLIDTDVIDKKPEGGGSIVATARRLGAIGTRFSRSWERSPPSSPRC